MKNEQGQDLRPTRTQNTSYSAEFIDWSARAHELMVTMLNKGFNPSEAKSYAKQLIEFEKSLVE